MKVLLVDDHPLFLEGLQNLLETRGFVVVGAAENGHQAISMARSLQPDVILMDIAMPGCSGLEAIRPIKAELPQIKIVMLTSSDDDENLFAAVKKGASGYLLKNLHAEELFTMLNALDCGEAPLSPGLSARLLEEFARQADQKKPDASTEQEAVAERAEATVELTKRQAEVLKLLAQGMTYKEIGAFLSISERTVKYHVEKIRELTNLENRAQLIAYAARERDTAAGN